MHITQKSIYIRMHNYYARILLLLLSRSNTHSPRGTVILRLSIPHVKYVHMCSRMCDGECTIPQGVKQQYAAPVVVAEASNEASNCECGMQWLCSGVVHGSGCVADGCVVGQVGG